ncbi:MAG: 2-C-methyl-D-erythritol 4-phosphate cytidylyltransferase, partial [Pseudomonadota bacterium]
MTTVAILVAGGRGVRAGGNGPKQWQPLAGRRVADWTVDAFATHPGIDGIVVVHHPDDLTQAQGLAHDPVLTPGGATRAASVQAGLQAARALAPQYVLIHDMARPCVSHTIINTCLTGLDSADGVAPALAVTDALWIGNMDQVTGTTDRTGLYRAQTPQGFAYDAICAAHAKGPRDAPDDVAVFRAAGGHVTIVPGSEDNLKITHPPDFARAERILGTQMNIRVGNGYDVHKFGPGTS